jgi:hypothetical protein
MTDATSSIRIPNYGLMAIWLRRLLLAGLLTFVACESMALQHCWNEDEYLINDEGVQLGAGDRRTLLTTGRKIRQCEPLHNTVVNRFSSIWRTHLGGP